jgi:putative transposase
MPIFLDDQDFTFFISLFRRYLSNKTTTTNWRTKYTNYSQEISLNAYCLMKNHVHILIEQQENPHAITSFMKSIMTSYSMYFNKKYGRRGPVFESRYKANIINKENYFEHISRYIHLNPKKWQNYPYSSIDYYTGKKRADWLNTSDILEMFDSSAAYLEFLNDYKDHKETLDEIKWELAEG